MPIDAPDEVAISIAESDWLYWEDFELLLGLDSYASASFAAPFEPDRPRFRQLFRPFSYHPVVVSVDGQQVFGGTLIDVLPDTGTDRRSVSVGCYAKPAVLLVCSAPANLLPLETRGLTLKQIADRLCQPFGVGVVMEGSPGAPFKRVKQQPESKVQDYLVDLAHQRGRVLTNTADGKLRIYQSTVVGRPVASLEEGKPPVIAVRPTFQSRAYYSEITGIVAAKISARASRYTENNPRLTRHLRCDLFHIDRAERADAQNIVRARMGRMFGNAFEISVDVASWRDPSGALWWPNTTVRLKAPGAMVWSAYEFIVRTVALRRNKDSKTATLGLVMPGAFDGRVPPRLPWD
jgi:prophage tail gpP-like protein